MNLRALRNQNFFPAFFLAPRIIPSSLAHTLDKEYQTPVQYTRSCERPPDRRRRRWNTRGSLTSGRPRVLAIPSPAVLELATPHGLESRAPVRSPLRLSDA